MGSLFTRERVRFVPDVPLTLHQARLLVEQKLVNTPIIGCSDKVMIYPLGHELQYGDDVEVIETLLAGGADVNRCAIYRECLVDTAFDTLWYGHCSNYRTRYGDINYVIYITKLIELLLDYGADASFSRVIGEIYFYMRNLPDIKTVHRLISHGASTSIDIGYPRLSTDRRDIRAEKWILQSFETLSPTEHNIRLKVIENTIILAIIVEGS